MYKKPFDRSSRVAVEIKRVISDLLLKNVGDPRLENVTITSVKMSKDLRRAKIYFVVYQSSGKVIKTIDGFMGARGYVKHELARRMRLRYMPEIIFFYDNSFDYAAHMNKVLKSIADLDEYHNDATK